MRPIPSPHASGRDEVSEPVARSPLRMPPFSLTATTDAEFATRADTIARYLYQRFPRLRGLGQRGPHFDPARGRTTDPVEHTAEVIQLLDTTGLGDRDRVVLRAAAIFHDVGKVIDPLNPRHATASAELTAALLDEFEFSPEERADTIVVIAAHDVLGRVAGGLLSPREAAELLRTPRMAEITSRLTIADVSSIRGLSGAPARIEGAYDAVRTAFQAMPPRGQPGG